MWRVQGYGKAVRCLCFVAGTGVSKYLLTLPLSGLVRLGWLFGKARAAQESGLDAG